jgi:hypothetical protein
VQEVAIVLLGVLRLSLVVVFRNHRPFLHDLRSYSNHTGLRKALRFA